MNDLNLMLGGVLAFAALMDLFVVLVLLRGLPPMPRLVMIGFALVMLVVAALQLTGTTKLIG